jgi:hypothetical protein
MPTVTDIETEGYAHCAIARCPGNAQEQVKAIRRETSRTYREMGGDAPGVESSWVTLLFADEEQRDCPHCGKPRELSAEPRVQYAPLSGHDPMGLLGVPQFDPARQQEIRTAPPTNEEREQWESTIRELREQIEALAKQGKESE